MGLRSEIERLEAEVGRLQALLVDVGDWPRAPEVKPWDYPESGPWVLLVPSFAARSVSPAVRRALSACYSDGYRSVPQILAASDTALLLAEGMGPKLLRALRVWLSEIAA